MKTAGASEAKACWNALLKRVSKGEVIRITQRGIPVAKMVPVDARERVHLKKVVQEIRELRKGATLGKSAIREFIDEGRRG